MKDERALRITLEGTSKAASLLEQLARRVRVGLRILRARVAPDVARFELELTGSARGLDRVRRELRGAFIFVE